MGAEWMEEVEKARKKAEKLGTLHWLDDDDYWLDDVDHWLVYIAWLIDSWWALIYCLMIGWYVCTFILQCCCHIVAYYCYLHSLDDNLCDTIQPSVLWTMIRRRRKKMPSETPSLKVILSLFVCRLRIYCDCDCNTKCN